MLSLGRLETYITVFFIAMFVITLPSYVSIPYFLDDNGGNLHFDPNPSIPVWLRPLHNATRDALTFPTVYTPFPVYFSIWLRSYPAPALEPTFPFSLLTTVVFERLIILLIFLWAIRKVATSYWARGVIGFIILFDVVPVLIGMGVMMIFMFSS
ncbi:MAG: hypothetical protein HYR90_00440 [Candidatus Andersenbacteria bacterium]|nr:hypothetical protein [Candidatus Andersenbacteria bacterium]MBI3250701.1 hypothetical protein [Candidatus Andersenbacteria bacterium]